MCEGIACEESKGAYKPSRMDTLRTGVRSVAPSRGLCGRERDGKWETKPFKKKKKKKKKKKRKKKKEKKKKKKKEIKKKKKKKKGRRKKKKKSQVQNWRLARARAEKELRKKRQSYCRRGG